MQGSENGSRFVPFDGVSGLQVDDLSALCDGETDTFGLPKKPKCVIGLLYNGLLLLTKFRLEETSLVLSWKPDSGETLNAVYLV